MALDRLERGPGPLGLDHQVTQRVIGSQRQILVRRLAAPIHEITEFARLTRRLLRLVASRRIEHMIDSRAP